MAENQHVFRTLNERIAAREPRRLEILCECQRELCTEAVRITPVEFHEVRRHRGWYVVRPGHDLDEAEVVDRQQSFWVVTTAAGG